MNLHKSVINCNHQKMSKSRNRQCINLTRPMYTIRPSQVTDLSRRPAWRAPAARQARPQVIQPGRWDAGRPSAGMGYYPWYPSLRLGLSHAFETMLQDIAVICPPAQL